MDNSVSNLVNTSSNVAKRTQEKIGLSANISCASLDKAAVYLHTHGQLPEEGSVNEKTLVCKIDWRIIPLALACYVVVVVDKINISVRILDPILRRLSN
jgi:hypothetical protein